MAVNNVTSVSEVVQLSRADTVTGKTSFQGKFAGMDLTLKMQSREDLSGALNALLKGQIAKSPQLSSPAMTQKMFHGATGHTNGSPPQSYQNIRQRQESNDSMPVNR